jgi:cell division septal protein FtsQ
MPVRKSKARRRRYRKFESVGTLILGQVSAKARTSSPALRPALLLMAGIVAALAVWMGVDDRFYIRSADVQGATRTLPAEIFRASGLQGLHLLWARPARAEQHILSSLPTLESARVKCRLRLPAECTILVRERQPTVAWNEGHMVWWLDAEGVIFTPSPTGGEEIMWTVHGPLPRDGNGRLIESVRVALNELWASGAELPASFDYVPGRGLTFINPQGWRVIIGEGAGMEKRLAVLERLTVYLEERGLSPRFVDVRFPETPYYSLVNEW